VTLFIKKIRLKLLFVFAFFLFAGGADFSVARAAAETDFFIDSTYDFSGRNSITATSRFESGNAHFYVEDAYWANLSPADQTSLLSNITGLGKEFDNAIYPSLRQFYGSEWTPGIDNDSKIYVLLTDIIKDAGGYFNPNDEYYKNQVKDNRSNEKEIIYLNVNFADKANIKPFLAHEFQHMINWYQKKVISTVDEDVWLNEALSEYSYTLLGYDNPFSQSITQSRVKIFREDPSDSLTEWKNMDADYSSVNMFMQFMADRYGKDIIKTIITSKKSGIEAVNDALQRSGFAVGFSDVFSNWVIANYLNDKTILDGKYAYLNQNLNYNILHVTPKEILAIKPNTTIKSSDYTKDWAGKWYQFTAAGINNIPNQTLKITFSSDDPAANFQIPYVVKNIDGTANIGFLALDSQKKGIAYVNNFGTAVTSVVLMPISGKKTAFFTDSEPMTRFEYSVSLVQSNIPVVKSVNPAASSVIGGDDVIIIGENFTSDTIVRFGGVAASQVSIPDSKTIIAKVPPYPQSGSVSIEISNLNSLSTVASQKFTYFPAVSDGTLMRAEGDIKVYLVKGKYKRWIQSPKIFNMYNFRWDSIVTVVPQTSDYYETSRLIRADGDYKVYETDANNIKRHLNMTAEKFSLSGRSWDAIYIISAAERNLYRTGAAITK
jgi:hypothetical protein